MRTLPLRKLLDPARPLTYGIVQAGPDIEGGTRYIRPADMTETSGVRDESALLRTSDEIAAAYARASVRAGDLILSIGPSYGKVMVVPDSLNGANLTQGTARLAPSEEVSARWLYWVLQSKQSKAFWDAVSAGGTFRALNLGPLGETPVALIPLAEQRRIADFLDDRVARIDQVITARRSQHRVIDSLARSELASVAFQGSALMPLRYLIVDERLGLWGQDPGVDEVEVWVARVADFHRPEFRLGSVPTRRSASSSQVASRLLRHGDVLLERSGGTRINPVGCPGFVDSPRPSTVCSNFVSRLRPAPDTDGRYLSLLLGAMYSTRQQEPHSNQTTGIQNLDSESYLKTRVPVRSIDEQRRAAKMMDTSLASARARQSALEASVSLLSECKQSLITAAVTGELDVTTAGSGIPG